MTDDYYLETITSPTKIGREVQRRLQIYFDNKQEVEYSNFIKEMTEAGYDKIRTEEVIEKMHDGGIIFYPMKKYISLIV